MTTLGEAVVDVGADTNRLRRETLSGAKRAGDEAGEAAGEAFGDQFVRDANGRLRDSRGRFVAEGERLGQSFGAGFRKGSGGRGGGGGLLDSKSFGQLEFSFAKIAGKASLLLSTIVPLPAALGGVAAAAVAVTGAVGLAGGALLSAGTAASSLGLAAVTAKVAFGGMADAAKLQTKAMEEMRIEGEVSETTQKALNDAMKQLAPSARAVLKEVKSLSPAWAGLRKDVQESAFKNIAPQMREVSDAILPVLTKNLGATAGLLNKAATGVANFVTSGNGLDRIDFLLGGLNKNLALLLPAIGNVASGLLTLFAGSVNPAASLSQSILNLSERFEAFASRVVASGAFVQFLDRAKVAGAAVIGVITNLGQILGTIFSAGSAQGVGLLQTFQQQTQALENLLKSAEGQTALTNFFNLTAIAAQAFRDVIGALGPVLSGIGAVLGQLQGPLDTLRTNLLPIVTVIGQQLGAALTTVAPAVGVVAQVFADLVGFLQPLAPAILPAIAAFFAFQGAVAAPTAAMALLSGALKKFAVVAKVFRSALLLARGAVLAFNIILAANPIGLVVTALVALGVGLVVLYKKSETFRNAVNSVFTFLKEKIPQAISFIVNFIKQHWALLLPIFLGPIGVIVALVIKNFTLIKTTVTTIFNGIVTVVTTVFSAIVTAVTTSFSFLVTIVTTIATAIWTTITTIFTAIVTTVTTIWNGIVLAATAAWTAIRTVVTTAVTVIVTVVTTYFNMIRTVVSAVMGAIRGAVSAGWSAIRGVVSGAVSAVQNLVSTGFNALRGIVSRAFTMVVGAIRGAVSTVTSAVRAIISAITGTLGSLPGKMLAKGKEIIQKLIDGIKAKLEPLRKIASKAASIVGNLWPGSPVKEGPLKSLNRGHAGGLVVSMLAKGMDDNVRSLQAAANRVALATSASLNDAMSVPIRPPALPERPNAQAPTVNVAAPAGPALTPAQMREQARLNAEALKGATFRLDRSGNLQLLAMGG